MGFIDGLKELKKLNDEEKEKSSNTFKDILGENYKKWIALFYVILFGAMGGFLIYSKMDNQTQSKGVELMIQNKDYDEALKQLDKIEYHKTGDREDPTAALMKALLEDGETEKAKALFAWACSAGYHGKPLRNAVGLQISLVSYLNGKGLTEDAKMIQGIDCTIKED